MPIDEATYRQPAIKADAAGIAINCSVAFRAIADALDGLAVGRVPTQADISAIRDAAKSLTEKFDRLAGWTDE